MIDPITIGLIFKALSIVVAGATVVYVAYLTINAVRNHIRERRTKHHAKKMATIMKKEMENGNYLVATGFDAGDMKVTDVKAWEAKSLDSKLQKLPNGKLVLINN